MSKIKKYQKSSETESETSDGSSSGSESAEELQRKRVKKMHKQKDKKKKKHKARKEKKYRHNSATDNSSESSTESNSSEENRREIKKKIKESEVSPVKVKKERSRSRERDKYNSKSKWESPPRRARSHSREKYRNERCRSHEKPRRDRSRSRNRGRSQEHCFEKESERHHSNREREDRRDYKTRDSKQGGSFERRERSPRKDREKPRERNYGRDYTKREARSPNRSRISGNQRKETNSSCHEWGRTSDSKKPTESDKEIKEKEKPNFALSGALTEDANKVNGVVIKYAEPPEARKPKRRWRLYPFKGETALPVLHIHRQSCFLVGRDRKVADLAVDHPSCSKQHAALQYRLVPFVREDGSQSRRVRLYLIDLESANGTFLNNKRIDARKYYELIEKDVIKFGFSTREYVLLHENSKEDHEDDDIEIKEEPMDN